MKWHLSTHCGMVCVFEGICGLNTCLGKVFVCASLQLRREMWSMTEGAQRVSSVAVLLHFILRKNFASSLKGRPYSPLKCLGNISKSMCTYTYLLFWLSLPHQIQFRIAKHENALCVSVRQTPASHVTVISILQPTQIHFPCLFHFCCHSLHALHQPMLSCGPGSFIRIS